MKRKLVLYINHMCNCTCDFCYIRDMDSSFMDISTVDKIAEYINSNPKKYDVIIFIGGEPFITPDIMIDFIHKINDQTMTYSFMTNGLINLDTFHKKFPKRDYAFNISIKDYIDYDSSILEPNIRYLKKHDYHITLETVLTPDSISKLLDIVKYMIGFGEDIKILRQHMMGDIWSEKDVANYKVILPELISMAIMYYYKHRKELVLPNKLQYLESERDIAKMAGYNLVCQDSLSVCDIVGIDGERYLCDGAYGGTKFKLGYVWDNKDNPYPRNKCNCNSCEEYCYMAKNKVMKSFDELNNTYRPVYRELTTLIWRLENYEKTKLPE